jgi:hypothetical protein
MAIKRNKFEFNNTKSSAHFKRLRCAAAAATDRPAAACGRSPATFVNAQMHLRCDFRALFTFQSSLKAMSHLQHRHRHRQSLQNARRTCKRADGNSRQRKSKTDTETAGKQQQPSSHPKSLMAALA